MAAVGAVAAPAVADMLGCASVVLGRVSDLPCEDTVDTAAAVVVVEVENLEVGGEGLGAVA